MAMMRAGKSSVDVLGLKDVLKNLKININLVANQVGAGMKDAGLFLQRESQKVVPVHQGNLKPSAFTRAKIQGAATEVIVGYTASYAAFVHENLEAAHGAEFNAKHAEEIANAHTPAQRKMWFRRGPNQQAKFLERPAREKRDEMLKRIIRRVTG